jgi:1,3-beta-glucan synthase
MKQSKLRKRRVWRYAVLYFVLLVVFLALLVGPLVAGKMILTDSLIKSIPQKLMQPIHQDNNNTHNRDQTGTGNVSSIAAATSTGTSKVRLF